MATKKSTKRTVAKRKKTSGRSLSRWFWSLIKWLLLVAFIALVLYLLMLDIRVVSKFEGKRWQLPSHVYARPLELYQGAPLTKSQFETELKQLGYVSRTKPTNKGEYRRQGDRFTIQTRGFTFADGADKALTLTVEFTQNSVARLSANNTTISLYRFEPLRIGGIYPDLLEDRLLVKRDEVPDVLVDALIAVEDRAFYEHHGISLRGIARAFKVNLSSGSMAQGGSTLTQQLVKNFYLTNERSLKRKIKEILMSLLLDLHFDKDEILEVYLNEVYYGQSGKRAIHGVGMASQYYFRRPLDELNYAQLAFLVAVIQGPAVHDPWRHQARALSRRNLVLDHMQRAGIIENADPLKATGLGVQKRPPRSLNPYPSFMALVRKQLAESQNLAEISRNGLRIFTSFDPQIQAVLETQVAKQLDEIETSRKLEKKSLQAGAVLTRINSAEVVAMLGDRQAGFDGFNRAINARRPIGSLSKPVLYLSALQKSLTLISPLDDTSLAIDSPDNSIWQPRNYDGQEHGEVPLYLALSESYNLATAWLGISVGIDTYFDQWQKLGIRPDWPMYPSMLLGAGGLSPYEVSQAYHTIAADGFHTRLHSIRGIYDKDSQPLALYSQEVNQVVDAAAIHQLQYAMQVTMMDGTGKSAYNQFSKDIRLAGKTGTTNNQRDSWFAGFGGNYLGVFWVGRDNNGKTPLTGASGALHLWTSVMSEVERDSVNFFKPESINYYWVDINSGLLSAEGCSGASLIPFKVGLEPKNKNECAQKRDDADSFAPKAWRWIERWLD